MQIANLTKRRFYKAFGQRLRLTRLALGLTEAKAAEATGVTVKTWNRWEAGGRHKGHAVTKFLKAYDVSFDWIFDGDTSRLTPRTRAGKIAILPVVGPEIRKHRLLELRREVLRLWAKQQHRPEAQALLLRLGANEQQPPQPGAAS